MYLLYYFIVYSALCDSFNVFMITTTTYYFTDIYMSTWKKQEFIVDIPLKNLFFVIFESIKLKKYLKWLFEANILIVYSLSLEYFVSVNHY